MTTVYTITCNGFIRKTRSVQQFRLNLKVLSFFKIPYESIIEEGL